MPFCSATILADLLHGQHEFAARHGRADLEHAEVELVGDRDGDALLGGVTDMPSASLSPGLKASASSCLTASAALTSAAVGAFRRLGLGCGLASSWPRGFGLAISAFFGFGLRFQPWQRLVGRVASGSSGVAVRRGRRNASPRRLVCRLVAGLSGSPSILLRSAVPRRRSATCCDQKSGAKGSR